MARPTPVPERERIPVQAVRDPTLVMNDEGHHCMRSKAKPDATTDEKRLEKEMSKEERKDLEGSTTSAGRGGWLERSCARETAPEASSVREEACV